ncbi:metallo-beta-lactamase family protein [Dissulfuribacter thermophilus]|uniref:Metallo-beta-lactamase family protein n=1 Tax=Dissulfuribacter thermophilus TaxID=1156395 RepID=A0A1B9F5F1_9BACT|nr:N-acyl homoserine lactonase family protein [Dissulfuribacter thermophilus]OCC15178.1 metallo-beta-lactamase family protein [Dissulfuribacter thermophilus]
MAETPIYKIHPIVVGTKIFDKGMMTYQYDYGKEYTIPIYSWYIEGGDKRILVDTGLIGVIQSEDRERAIGGKIYTFEEGLSLYGLTPKDIDIVIHTHLHNDHCENDFKCINAVFYAHELEFESAYNPHPLDFRYMADFIQEIDEAGQMVHIKEEEYEVVPGIKMIHTPAHTKGGMSVLVNTEKGIAGISGFCTIMENFYPPNEIKAMEMDAIPPGTNINPYEAYDQVIRLREMVDIILPLHEPRFASMDVIPA